MMAMTKKAMIVMALVLVAATAATAATAFAGDKTRRLTERQVVDSVNLSAQKMLQLRIRTLQSHRVSVAKFR